MRKRCPQTVKTRPQLTNLGAAELELFKEIQHEIEDDDVYVAGNDVALSGSKLVAATVETGGRPGQVSLFDAYDAETGDLRKEIPFDYVRIARFSPDGSTLAVGGGFSNGGVGDVTIFDAASLTSRATPSSPSTLPAARPNTLNDRVLTLGEGSQGIGYKRS